MDLIETLAASPSFGASAITLYTMTKEDCLSDAFWERLEFSRPPTFRVNELWYAKRGCKSRLRDERVRQSLPDR